VIVAFDTGILVRATPPSSGPAKRLFEFTSGSQGHSIVLSEFILGELGKVLAYPRMQTLFELTLDDIHAYVADLRVRCKIIDPVMDLPIVLTDLELLNRLQLLR
jgi:predicted nucleic acid-binding protein